MRTQKVLPDMAPDRKRGAADPESPASPGEFEFFAELNMLFMGIMGEIILSPEDEPPPFFKLTHSQGRVMLYLSLRGPQRMSDIARLLCIGMASATPVVDGLVEAKLVRRLPDSKDRRVVRVELTAAGKRLHDQLTQHHAEKLKRVFGRISLEQQNEVLEHLRRVAELMKLRESGSQPST